MNAIEAHPALVCDAHEVSNEPSIAATMTWQIHIPIAPVIKKVFRPKLSRNSTAGRVNTIWKIPVTPVASSSVVTDVKPKVPKIWGA